MLSLTSSRTKLKYLFKVLYLDGDVFAQTEDDVSDKEPGRSAYFDVDQEAVYQFMLIGCGHVYLVDLNDGHFEIDGTPFKMHGADELGPSLLEFSQAFGKLPEDQDGRLRLTFFRRHKHELKIGKNIQQELSHDVTYRFGWGQPSTKLTRVMEVE